MSAVSEEIKKNHDDPMRVGTLKYTMAGLVALFIWMLWGDFWFVMMEQLIPRLLPLSLKDFNASNATIGLVVGSLAAVVNMFMVPVISFRSDRTRSRFGRRIPYLAFATPFVSIFLILIGWTPQIVEMLHKTFSFNMSPAQLGLALICFFAVCFQIFNMFVASVFYYLFADVVPEKYMGRFMAFFRLVASGASFVFNRYVLGLAETHMAWIYTGVAILYFISFTAMCMGVKEGEYPPPSDSDQRTSVLASIKLYFKECFSIPFYRWFFLGTAINAVSVVCRNMFNIFFAQENLHMSLDKYGKIGGWAALLGMVLALPLGWLVDKFRPIRLYLFGIVLVVLTNVFGFFMIYSIRTFFVFTLLLGVVYAIQSASTLPMYVELLPKKRFGQFCSAQAMLQSIILIAANYGGGIFIDWIGDYRYIYVWDAMWTSLALVAIIIVYRGWKKLGGAENYEAPEE